MSFILGLGFLDTFLYLTAYLGLTTAPTACIQSFIFLLWFP